MTRGDWLASAIGSVVAFVLEVFDRSGRGAGGRLSQLRELGSDTPRIRPGVCHRGCLLGHDTLQVFTPRIQSVSLTWRWLTCSWTGPVPVKFAQYATVGAFCQA